MKDTVFFDMHEKFTDESNTVIQLDDLLSYIDACSNEEKINYLMELLKISSENDKECLKAIKEYTEFLDKRNYSLSEKRKVADVKKVKPGDKKYINNAINEHKGEIDKIISLSMNEFISYVNDSEVDYNFLMLGIIKEIGYYQRFADEAIVNKDLELVNEARNEIVKLEAKLNYLKTKSKEVINDESTKCRILFLETSSLRSYFLEDIKGLDEYYDSFNKLFTSLENGNPYDVKYFPSIDKNLEGLAESRDLSGKTRIFFKRLNDNTYIIIGAMVKKVTRTGGYKNQLGNRYKYYLQQEPFILSNIDNEEFILHQNEILDETKEKLNPSNKTLSKKGGE